MKSVLDPRGTMKPCWRDRGLTGRWAALADKALPDVTRLIEKFGRAAVETATKEAVFRIYELPLRTKAFEKKYLKENT
jgi:hypothetical protein